MLDVVKFWRFYRHPVQRWAYEIRDVLDQLPIGDATVVDAPCGDGVIAYWLIKQGVGRKYELYDLSSRLTDRAAQMIDWPKSNRFDLRVEARDIHDIPLDGRTNDIWLLINSLFLLPDIDRMMERMRSRAKTIIAIFPIITSKNYQRFIAQSPEMNTNEMGKDEITAFFDKHGYTLEQTRDINCISLNYFRSKYAKMAGSYFLNPIEPLIPKEPCYWLGVFSRNDRPSGS